jgi:hypothetical protein
MRYFFVALIFCANVAGADDAKPSAGSVVKSTESMQIAVVQGQGATVYAQPSFDSKVLGIIPAKKKVRASRKTYSGTAGFGAFYKIFLKNNKFGYIADTDLIPQFTTVGVKKEVKANPEFEEAESRRKERDPMYFTRYIGGALESVNFTEKFSGQSLHSQTLMYGLKVTGPNILFDGPPIDFNVLFHFGAPSYYGEFATSSASGFFLMTDAHFMLPLFESRNNLVTLGGGPLLIFTDFKFNIGSTYFDSEELRVGLSFAASYVRRFNQYAARLQLLYNFEKTQYFGLLAGFQVEY